MTDKAVIRPVVAADVPQVVALVRNTLAEFGLAFGEGAETDTPLFDRVVEPDRFGKEHHQHE